MNKSKLKKTTLSILLFCTFSAFAQKTISLKNERTNLILKDYFVQEVIDNRSNQNSIGYIFDENRRKNTINFYQNTSSVINNFINKNIKQNYSSTPITLIINNLTIFESLLPNGTIEGKCQMNVSFQKVLDDKNMKIASTQAGFTFNRNVGYYNDEHYEKIIRQMTTTCLQYFNNWLEKNSSKSEGFSKGSRVVLIPELDKSDEDTLYFSTRKLNWSDFRGTPPRNTSFAAAVYPSMGYLSSFTVKNGFIEAHVRPQVYVLREMSWVKNNSRNNYALAHEQLHFNIAKIVMERFKQKIILIKGNSMDEINSRIQYEYLESFREMNKIQQQYDGETNHGIIEQKQQEWAEKVENELAQILKM